MGKVQIIEIKKSIYANNDMEAGKLRQELHNRKSFMLNLMSSPGSGKTSLVLRTIEALRNEMSIGVMEADIDSAVDAERVASVGIPAIQVHTGGMCHLDASMTRQGIEAMGENPMDLIILENVGNLICPASYDVGAAKSAMILSVPEGDDKPLKYPLMFSAVDVLLINKIDAMHIFDFDVQAVRERVQKINPKLQVFEVSAKTGAGINAWADWLRNEVSIWKG